MATLDIGETVRDVQRDGLAGALRSRFSTTTVLGYIAAFTLAMSVLLPVLYMFLTTFRPASAVYAGTPYWIPKTFTLENYAAAWEVIRQPLVHSIIIASGTCVLSLIITVPGAYALGRLDFAGKRKVFFFVVVALMFPAVLLVGPVGSTWRDLGLYDTYHGLWIAYQAFVSPFSLWILRDFFEGLPNNLEEAAMVYGCSKVSAIYRVVVPLSAPALIAVMFLAFLQGWNDFLFSNLLTTEAHRPAVVQLFRHTAGTNAVQWEHVLPQTFIVGVPPAALYFLAQRYMSETFAM